MGDAAAIPCLLGPVGTWDEESRDAKRLRPSPGGPGPSDGAFVPRYSDRPIGDNAPSSEPRDCGTAGLRDCGTATTYPPRRVRGESLRLVVCGGCQAGAGRW